MCGINGVIGIVVAEEAQSIVETMNDSMAHRGPDDSGCYVGEGVVFGQRRLSIIDLSKAGHQPMVSQDESLVLIFNGEIYNYRELKQELEEYPFKTQTDTEVILAAYTRWGKECVHRFNGMFAFAIWDKVNGEVLIFRDRLGVKPIYFYRTDSVFLFSSEIRSLLKSGLVPRKLNKAALSDYLRYQTVHAPQTIVADVQMLLPGHFISIKSGAVELQQYWSAEKNYNQEAVGKSYEEVKKDVYNLLLASVERRLVADVPFGAFLSGGIDSSAIVGLMSRVATQKVRTFAVTFEEEAFSEARYAAAIAKKFGTEHTEIRLQPTDFLELLPAALKAMDHPSGDGPNTYVVSKVTKEAGITMALSGLGGDELFAGYDVFKRLSLLNNFQWFTKVPVGLRRVLGQSLNSIKPSVATSKVNQLLSLSNWTLHETYPINRQLLSDSNVEGLISNSMLSPNQAHRIVKASITAQCERANPLPHLSQVSLAEIQTYMQNTLLRDTDQMSMAHALEVRVPFLDYELVEYVLGVPDAYKYPSSPKKLLTEALRDLLPMEIINRPKMGFTLPWKDWLRGELLNFCEKKLKNLAQHDVFVEHEIIRLWQSFLKRDPSVSWAQVWYLVVLENWLQENGIE